MKISRIILLVLICTSALCQGNNCPSFNAGDRLQSGKNSLVRSGTSNRQYKFDAPISFTVPNTGFQFAITTSTIGGYTSSSGFSYQISGQRKANSNFLQMTLIASTSGWNSVQVSWFASARTDFAVGNVQFPLAQWVKGSADTYTLTHQIAKTLPSGNYLVAAFISGFSTTSKEFQINVNQKTFSQSTRNLSVVILSRATPQPASITLSFIIYPETHAQLQLSYEVRPQGDSGSYQISGPVTFSGSSISYNEFRIANRFLVCEGNQCYNTCILREECLQIDGNAYEGRCVFCAPGIVFEYGTCTRRCGANQIYLNRVCICNSGFVRKGRDCVREGAPSCTTNQILVNNQCRTCPTGATVSNNNCVCPAGQSYDSNNNRCNLVCGANEVVSNGACTCAPNFYRANNACRQCPSGSTVNGAQNSCVCPNSQVFDLAANRCNPAPVQCGANQVVSGNRCICAAGFVLNGSTCRQCPAGSRANQTSNTCVCQDGFTFNSSTNTCVSRCGNSETWVDGRCSCISGYARFNGACRQCPKSALVSANQQTCECISPKAYFIQSSNLCIQCGANSQPNAAKTACTCLSGFTMNGTSCVPNLQCGLNQIANNNQCQCKFAFIRVGPLCVEACGINEYFTDNGCLCNEGHAKINGVCRPCPSGSLPNPAKTTCLCVNAQQYFVFAQNSCVNCPANSFPNADDSDCTCQPGYRKEANTCISTCPGESSPDSTGRCICPGGKVLLDQNCIVPVTCPQNSTFNSTTSTCQCTNRRHNIIDGRCQACPQNSVWRENQCVCGTGFFSIGGQCRTCDARSSYNGTDCICRLGYFGNRDLCTPCHSSCSQCSGPQANQCLACSDVSLVLQDGFCSKNSPCDFGFFLDNGQCSKCLDNCIECETIFECKTCALGYKTNTQELSGQRIVSCEEICGDGIKYEHQCDDGNTQDGDGCSSTCQEEQGWFCSGGSSNAPSVCKKFIPDIVQLSSKGAVNLGGSVVMSVRASYLPSCISENECSRCFKAITANVVNANVPILVTINYVPFSQYQFYVKFDFQGLFVTSIFKVVIRLNEEFKGCISEEDYNEQLEITVDPSFLAKSEQVQTLTLDNTIVIPADLKNYLG